MELPQVNGRLVNLKNLIEGIERQVAVLSIRSSWQDILKYKKKKLRRRKRKKNLTDEQKDMVEWSKENWVDMANPDGKKKKGTYKRGRYAPKAVADALTDNQRAAENKKKREGRKKGKHNVPRTKAGKKVYRRIEGR